MQVWNDMRARVNDDLKMILVDFNLPLNLVGFNVIKTSYLCICMTFLITVITFLSVCLSLSSLTHDLCLANFTHC